MIYNLSESYTGDFLIEIVGLFEKEGIKIKYTLPIKIYDSCTTATIQNITKETSL
jgi:hypothetical protein